LLRETGRGGASAFGRLEAKKEFQRISDKVRETIPANSSTIPPDNSRKRVFFLQDELKTLIFRLENVSGKSYKEIHFDIQEGDEMEKLELTNFVAKKLGHMSRFEVEKEEERVEGELKVGEAEVERAERGVARVARELERLEEKMEEVGGGGKGGPGTHLGRSVERAIAGATAEKRKAEMVRDETVRKRKQFLDGKIRELGVELGLVSEHEKLQNGGDNYLLGGARLGGAWQGEGSDIEPPDARDYLMAKGNITKSFNNRDDPKLIKDDHN
jgi:hypothetical protein